MATLYVDFEQGNDNHGGTSFALLASGTNGRITSTTFSASGANFPNDGSLINQYLSIFNGTIYVIYQITNWVNSTSLTIAALSGGTALANQAVDRQYFIGGRWQTLTNGATAVRIMPGDTIRIKASSDPTSLGINGTWTSSPLRPTRSISSSTNASPIVVTSNNHGYANGDTVVITGHTTNTNANGTWEIANVATNSFSLVGSTGNGTGGATGTVRLRNNSVVKLESAVTANIASCGNRGQGRVAWTSADPVNVPSVILNTTDFKEGDCSDSINIGANFTTGKAAFFATGNLNLSGYQQVSFWVKQTAGSLGTVSLRLCSDTAGNTPIHTISMNSSSIGALNVWNPITFNFATNLSSSIQSIALYVDSDTGGATYLFSNIIACKASSSPDSLSLISLIGKNTATEPWIAIQSINGTRVFLDGLVANLPTTTLLMGYNRTSETVIAHKRETIQVLSSQSLLESGLSNSYFFLSGGWNTSDMSTQTMDTYLDGRRGNTNIISAGTSISYWNISKINIVRGASALIYGTSSSFIIYNDAKDLNHNSNAITITNLSNACRVSNINNICFNNNGLVLQNTNSNHTIMSIQNIDSNGGIGIANSTALISGSIDTISSINNNGGVGLSLDNARNTIINNIVSINNNTTRGILITNSCGLLISNISDIRGSSSTITSNTYTNPISLSSCDNCQLINISGVVGATASAISCTSSFNNQFVNVNTSGSTTSAFAGDIGSSYCRNCTFSESTLVTGLTTNREGRVFLQNQNNNSNNHQIHLFGGLISTNTSVKYGNSAYSWSFSPTNSIRNSAYPLSLSLAKVYVVANKLVTVRAMMSRNDNGLTIRLRVKANQIAGVSSDITSQMVLSSLPWEQVSLTFTPTESGVVEILGEAFGGTTFTGYIDNLTISQEA